LVDDLDLGMVLKVDTDILPMVHSMMQNGMAVDLDHLRNLSIDYDARMRAKATELSAMVGHPFNPMSSLQVATVIYNELGFKPTKKTDSGLISTDDSELKKTKHPVAKGIIQYRGILKLKSTYADALVNWAYPDSNSIPRVHTTLKTTRVETGRLSSSDPNLQNIPTRNKEAKAIKNAFIAPPGMVMIEADYSQIEMVLLAHLSNCRRLVDLFNRGGDPHTEMAATIFGLPMPKYDRDIPDEASKSKYRYPVKRLNFGIAYLIGPQGLANQIQEYIADLEMEGEPVDIEPWDELTCEKFIGDWYKINPEVKDFQLEMAAMARRFGYVNDILGRMRFIPEANCPIRSIQEAGLRQAANMPVTSSAQEVIKVAMSRLWNGLPRTPWANDASFVMQIHDSLIAYVKDDEKVYRPFLSWMLKVMTTVIQLRIPIKADVKIGHRWAEMEKIKLEDK
jgi:DNA polymerase-1